MTTPVGQTVYLVVGFDILDTFIHSGLVRLGIHDAVGAHTSFDSAQEFLKVVIGQARRMLDPPTESEIESCPCLAGMCDPKWVQDRKSAKRFQIVEIVIDMADLSPGGHGRLNDPQNPPQKCWCYNIDGELLWRTPQDQSITSAVTPPATPDTSSPFRVGELVWIAPQAQVPASESLYGHYGVVASPALTEGEGAVAARCPEKEGRRYLVFSINERGLWQETHEYAQCMTTVLDALPEKFEFLKVLSRHLRGEVHLPPELMTRILQQRVYLFKEPRFQFTGFGY